MIIVHLLWTGVMVFLICGCVLLSYFGSLLWLRKVFGFVGFVMTVVYAVLLNLH
jgi:hypothetical protein